MVVGQVEVLRVGAGFEPNEGRWKFGEKPRGDFLSFFHRDLFTGFSRNDQVEEILFPFELVSEFTDGTAECIGLDADAGESVLFARSRGLRIELGQLDDPIRFDMIDDCGQDGLAGLGLLLGRGHGPITSLGGIQGR